MDRLEFLKRLGMLAAGAALGGVEAKAANPAATPQKKELKVEKLDIPVQPLEAKVDKPITVMIIGAGSRGTTYARYAANFPKAMKVVAVSDINAGRAEKLRKAHKIAKDKVFGHYNEALAQPKLADAVVIATPDDRHFEPCMKALELGYDVLLEKPAAPTEKECRAILKQAQRYNRIVAVCHVLRYAPYFRALKEVIDSGAIGELVSIQHMEPIEYSHMAHSYVRGNWHNSKATSPIILAKSCHDLDILRWLSGQPCEVISAEGSLHLFKRENAPEGAPERCTDGCPHEATCPFSAIEIYERRHQRLRVFDLPRVDNKLIREKLRTTDYGRCVYYCNNDQCDHYVTTIRFQDGITASFSMEAFTPWGGRLTRVMGTRGFIEGDMKEFTLTEFRTGRKLVWDKKVNEIAEYKGAGHGGGDHALVRDFVYAVSAQDPKLLSSTIEASIESHLMAFAAEKSRKSMRKMTIK